MEPAEQKRVTPPAAPAEPVRPPPALVEFLNDADAIEQRPLPAAARYTLFALVGLILFFLVAATVSEIDMVVSARGKIVTRMPNMVVQPLETSVIRSIDVTLGQVVKKGQTLGTLDSTFASADAARLTQRLASLAAQIERLKAESAGAQTFDPPGDGDMATQVNLFRERQAAYRSRLLQQDETLARLDAGLRRNRQDEAVLRDRLTSLQEVERMRQELFKKDVGSKLNVLASRDQRLEAERNLQSVINQRAELIRERAATEAARDAFVNEWRQKITEELISVQREHDGVLEELNKAQRRNELITLTAPADAIVLDAAKRPVGSVVREAEPVFTLVPVDSTLEAEVQIEARDIGFIHPGNIARIKLDAFPYQKHGLVDGTLTVVSEDTYVRERTEAAGSQPYYLARLSLDRMGLNNLPKGARLLPGMTVTTEIVVGQRTVLSYLLYPLIRALDESMTER